MTDAIDELQVLCAAHELGLHIGEVSKHGVLLWHVVWEHDAQTVVCKSVTREGAIAWLAERVFKPHQPGKIDWE